MFVVDFCCCLLLSVVQSDDRPVLDGFVYDLEMFIRRPRMGTRVRVTVRVRTRVRVKVKAWVPS